MNSPVIFSRHLLLFSMIIITVALIGCGGSPGLIRLSEEQLVRLEIAKRASAELAQKTKSTQDRLFKALHELRRLEREAELSSRRDELIKKYFKNSETITPRQLERFLKEWQEALMKETDVRMAVSRLEAASRAEVEGRAKQMDRLFSAILEVQRVIHEAVVEPGINLGPLLRSTLSDTGKKEP